MGIMFKAGAPVNCDGGGSGAHPHHSSGGVNRERPTGFSYTDDPHERVLNAGESILDANMTRMKVA
jgi:hypothetical protein